jgi:CheY-like chemotaxis protein
MWPRVKPVCRDKQPSYYRRVCRVRSSAAITTTTHVVFPMQSLNGLVILIVEDDDDARELMQAVLEQRGATVSAAESVARAFELLSLTTPDVVVSDIAMPEEDGLTLARRLRALPADGGGQTPIIAVSAYAGSADRVRALAAGFDRYLHKPVDFEELSMTITSIVDRSVGKQIA